MISLCPSRDLAIAAANAVSELRTKFTGKEFTEVAAEFSEAMRVRKITWDAVEKGVQTHTSEPRRQSWVLAKASNFSARKTFISGT
jgi:hypothetical protein